MNPAASSGAWLLLDRGSQAPVALPVPRQACLGLTRAVLFCGGQEMAHGAGRTSATTLGWRAAWEHAGSTPAVAVWLAAREGLGGLQSRALARSLAASLVLEDDLHSGRASAARFVSPSAWCDFLNQAEHSVAGEADASWRDVSASRERADKWFARIEAGGIDHLVGLPPPACSTAPVLEAIVLRDAVNAAVALEVCAGRFEAAVAESRLAAMRELAYGAGHEINNPLANIATRAQALLLEESDPERRRRLSTIVDQAFRARDMIGGLMLFARPPKPRPGYADVGEVVAAVIESAQPLATARAARLEYSPPPAPLQAWVDRSQVEEALRAVAVNALEAVEPGGRVVLAVHGNGAAGAERPMCTVSIADDGHGMDEDTVKRAFDPFFSGREAGRGAGLGLSKALRLIESNAGELVIESRRGHGTRVAIELPLHPVTRDMPTVEAR